jgi:adenylate cyclase
MKKGILKLLAAFFLSILLTFSYLFLPSTFFSLDNRLRDFMFILRGELPKNDTIVIIDIDDKSLKKYDQWPWSRDIVSKLLTNINQHNPGIIGLDIVFSEIDRSSPHLLNKKFPSLSKNLPNYDEILSDTFQNAPIVGGYIFLFDTHKKNSDVPIIPAIIVQKGLKNNQSILSPDATILNIPLLQDALYSSGFFNNIPDANGMIRKVPLIMKYDNTFFTSLSLEMVRIYSNQNRVNVMGDSDGIDTLSFGDYHIPIDNAGRLFVNFRGPKHHYEYISASDILDNTIESSKLKNKFVLVGTSALGLYDLRAIAYDSNIPGVEIHANVIDNLLSGDYLSQPRDYVLYNIIILWVLIFVLMYIFNQIRSWLIVPFAVVLFYGIGYALFALLFQYGLVLNLLFPLLAFILTLIVSIAIDYVVSYKQKEEAKKILGKKVSTSVMNHLIKHASEGLVNPKEVEATVFFSDIQGFTSISEKIGSPVKLIEMLNTYMTPMVRSIITHEGTIDKFIGDAIMAYWNAPLEIKMHQDKALQSAIEQIESLKEINTISTKIYDVEINIGIGLHTGLVTAGDMGAEGRSDYTVIGDNVNLASRLEGLTRYYDVQLLISEATYQALLGTYNIRPIDTVAVKGKSKPVKIYEVICNTKTITDKESSLYLQAFEYYQEGQIKEAFQYFSNLVERYPSKLYKQYQDRCQYALRHPEEPFDFVLKMQTK